MSETLGIWPPSIHEYQQFVDSTRREDAPGRPWTDTYAGYIDMEHLELMFQHGPAMELLLFPEAYAHHKKFGLHHHMADELSDVLWFTTDIANRYQLDLASVSAEALGTHAGRPIDPATNFSDLQELVMAHADQIAIPNKRGTMTHLVNNPQYVLMRTLMRLSRHLADGRHDMMPPSATELEPIGDIKQILGDYIIVAAYIAQARLDTNIEAIAHFNQAKLEHRQRYGKENDLTFTVWLDLRGQAPNA